MAVDKKALIEHPTNAQKKYMEVIGALTIDDVIIAALKAAEAADEIETNAVLIKEVLLQKVYALGEKSYKNDLASVSVQTRKNPDRIDRTKLIAAGVDPDVIDACTIAGGESDAFVVVRAAKVRL
jgi:hypothetical protein